MVRLRRIILACLLNGVIALCALRPIPVAAFSAYGDGTSGSPYRISTCSQLQEIGSALTAYYVVVRDIDCSGGTFSHMGTFSGTLDGQNHTIDNLNIDSDGLFTHVNGGTIKNLKIASGSVSSTGYLGSFAGRATDATFSNVHSAMTITAGGGGAYAGGITGSLSGTTSVTKSSFSGSLTSDAYSGGIVGAMWDAGTSVTDSFVDGSVTAQSVYVGAAIGAIFNGTVNRVYSSATLDAGGHDYVGGLVGDDQTTLSNSFGASTITNLGGATHGLIGLHAGGTYVNDYFDTYLAGTGTCGNTGGSCTAVNASNATPNYFKNNTTNGPLSTWDFVNVWATTTGYPTLRALANFASPTGVPNSGDANGDGTADAYQPTVASVANSSNVWSTIELASGSGCTVENPQAYDAASAKTDNGFTSPLSTMTAFDLYCAASGGSATVTIVYDKLYDTSGALLRFYNPTTNSYRTVSGATFGTRTVGGTQKTTVTYTITDGGVYDTDGAADGIIHDPVGFAAATTSSGANSTANAPNTGVAPQRLNTTVAFLASFCMATAAGIWQLKKKYC